MPARIINSPSEDPSTHGNVMSSNEVRPSGSAGAASAEAIGISSQRVGMGSGGTVSAPGSHIAESEDRGNPPSARRITKEEADRLYEERIEEEYAKREGGA
ncbi:hypothetical protein VTN49DRAFT_2288 [Thermomyces lanuginosus]|uniref:uncharacterized protein n=1 Tax=Thermomyces lanuginosus TaxID=5541 RepID=UPI0037439416